MKIKEIDNDIELFPYLNDDDTLGEVIIPRKKADYDQGVGLELDEI
jgi:hypothetical protein